MSASMIPPLNCARIKKIKIKLHPSLSRDGATESVDWKNPGRGARRWKSIWLLSASLPFNAASIKQKMDPFCMPTRISWKFTVGKSKRAKPKLRSVLHWTNLADFYLSGLELNKIEKKRSQELQRARPMIKSSASTAIEDCGNCMPLRRSACLFSSFLVFRFTCCQLDFRLSKSIWKWSPV